MVVAFGRGVVLEMSHGATAGKRYEREIVRCVEARNEAS